MAGACWRLLPADGIVSRRISEEFNLPEPVARILAARGIVDSRQIERFLKKSIGDLKNPMDVPEVRAAAERLARAVLERETVVIHGDFDADGITATALLTLFLKGLGASVEPFLPNRLTEGHGISERGIEFAREKGARLFVTCDCGISDAAGVGKLKAAGIETIVTDHHALPAELPRDAFLVNPKLFADKNENGDLSGVGVAFLLAVAVRAHLRELGFFAECPEPNLKEYLDIVALGTLADMAPLCGQNRILVAHGLSQLAVSMRAGVLAMKERAGLKDAAAIKSDDVGYRLAPRINAAARLGHAGEALALLMTADPVEAGRLADALEKWNQERRSMQERMTRIAAGLAVRQIEEGKAALVIASPDFHVGIIGLVAQKLAQMYGRPAFVFAREGAVARGSARTGRGVDLMEALGACSHLCLTMGGHREACGCSLEASKLQEFSVIFEGAVCRQKFAATRDVFIDAELNLRHLNEGVLNALDQLRPFGVGNPEPVLMSRARVLGKSKQVGQGHLRLFLSDSEKGVPFSAIGFGMWEKVQEFVGDVEVAYTPEHNVWQGRRSIQLRLQDVRSVQSRNKGDVHKLDTDVF